MIDSNSVLLSVVMITYNHEQYVKEAIEGVLRQELKFPYELIIANDKSTDSTNEIIENVIKCHKKGHLIKYTNHLVNKGVISNFTWVMKQAKGKYIAICEGDDYWTDHLKIQKQLDFLENNTDYTMCFHSVSIINEILNKKYPEVLAENRDYTIDEILLTKTAHTVSFVFKADHLKVDLFINPAIFGGDVFLALMMAERGKVYGMKVDMAVYRIHPLGISNLDVERLGVIHQKRFIKQFIFFKKTFQTLSKKAINSKIVDHCMTVAKYYYQKKNPQALLYLSIAVYHRPDLISKGFKKMLNK